MAYGLKASSCDPLNKGIQTEVSIDHEYWVYTVRCLLDVNY